MNSISIIIIIADVLYSYDDDIEKRPTASAPNLIWSRLSLDGRLKIQQEKNYIQFSSDSRLQQSAGKSNSRCEKCAIK